MIKVNKDVMYEIAVLFDGIEDSMVIGCLQGYMGDAYVDKLPNPTFGMIVSGEYSFFGGDSNAGGAKKLAETFFEYITGDESTAIYADNNLGWRDLLLSVSNNNPKEVMRYGIMQKDYDFDKQHLKSFIDALPAEYELRIFDKKLYELAMNEDWSKEFCETFSSASEYLKKGFGYAVMHKDVLVAATSTMTVYDGGTEIQVATREEYKRKGLAMASAAAFILECSKRKIRPCWDAANLTSKHMALRLGYEYRGEYSTVYMCR